MNFTCTCGKEFEFADSLAGRKARCRQCGHIFEIPGPDPVVAYEPPLDDDEDMLELEEDIFSEIRTITERLEGSHAALDKNTSELMTSHERSHSENDLYTMVGKAEKKIAETCEALDESKRAFRHAEVTLSYWQEKVRHAAGEKESLLEERNLLQDQLAEARTELESQRRKPQATQPTNPDAVREMKRQCEDLSERLRQLEKRLTTAECERDELQENLLKSLEDLEAGRHQIQELRDLDTANKKARETLEKQFRRELDKERYHAQDELQRAVAQRERTQLELKDLRGKLNKSRKTMQEMENELFSSQAQTRVSTERAKAELAQARTDFAVLQSELNEARAEVERERQKQDRLREHMSLIERQSSAKVTRLENELKAVQEHLHKSQDELIASETNQLAIKDHLSEKLERLQKTQAKNEEHIQELKTALKAARHKKDLTGDELDKVRHENQRLCREVNDLKDELKRMKVGKSRMTEVLNAALEQARQARKDLDLVEDEIEHKHTELVEVEAAKITEPRRPQPAVKEMASIDHAFFEEEDDHEQDFEDEMRRSFGEDLVEELAKPSGTGGISWKKVPAFAAVALALFVVGLIAVRLSSKSEEGELQLATPEEVSKFIEESEAALAPPEKPVNEDIYACSPPVALPRNEVTIPGLTKKTDKNQKHVETKNGVIIPDAQTPVQSAKTPETPAELEPPVVRVRVALPPMPEITE